jgi:hypothetical protein
MRVNSFWLGWCMCFHDAYSLESMCHAALLVRGSNKVQLDSPVHTGKVEPDLAKGQVLLNLCRQAVCEKSQVGRSMRVDMFEIGISEFFAKDR